MLNQESSNSEPLPEAQEVPQDSVVSGTIFNQRAITLEIILKDGNKVLVPPKGKRGPFEEGSFEELQKGLVFVADSKSE